MRKHADLVCKKYPIFPTAKWEKDTTQIREKPQNVACLEQHKNSNHERPHQLFLTDTSCYKHLSNSSSAAEANRQ